MCASVRTSPAHIPSIETACSRVMPEVRSPSTRSDGRTSLTGSAAFIGPLLGLGVVCGVIIGRRPRRGSTLTGLGEPSPVPPVLGTSRILAWLPTHTRGGSPAVHRSVRRGEPGFGVQQQSTALVPLLGVVQRDLVGVQRASARLNEADAITLQARGYGLESRSLHTVTPTSKGPCQERDGGLADHGQATLPD